MNNVHEQWRCAVPLVHNHIKHRAGTLLEKKSQFFAVHTAVHRLDFDLQKKQKKE
jgi:hypothetical protein